MSLRELMEFLAQEWSGIIREFDRLANPLDMDLFSAFVGFGDTSKAKEKLRLSLERIADHCRAAGLSFTAGYVNEIIPMLSASATKAEQVRSEIEILRKRFDDETKDRPLVFVDSVRASYYPSCALFGDTVLDQFSKATFDITEAGHCYALGRDTACVFHLMSVLQLGLNALAKTLEVAFEYANWDTVINQIEAKIKKIESGELKSIHWTEDRTFYSETALQFRHFKDAWRNHVMHSREHYDGERAASIFTHVKEFMQHLATRLSE